MLSNPIKLSSYFTFKDFIPKDMTSSLVYEFSCALNSVPVSYVEMTKRHLYQRMAEHAGRNARANNHCHSLSIVQLEFTLNLVPVKLKIAP